MGFFDLRARIKFTTDCVRYNSAHFIAIWWVNEDGSVWTDKTNQTPYLFLVRKGTGNHYNLREATNFDIDLDIQNIFTPNYNCRIHTQCNNHKLRIMVIPVCKIPNLNTYTQFETAFNNASLVTSSDGDYAIIRLDDNPSYSSSYNAISVVLKDYINNNLSGSYRSFGESIIDIDVVNSIMKNCVNRVYKFEFLSNITTGNSLNFYTICGSTSSSGNLIVPSYQLFPNPIDNGNPINNFTFNNTMLLFRVCHRGLYTIGEIAENGFSFADNQQYALVSCCNTFEYFNVSITSTASQSFKYFVFYQDADPTSSTFLQFVNQVIRFGDLNYSSSINGIRAIPGSLYVVRQEVNNPTTGDVVHQSAASGKIFSTTIPNGTGNDTLKVIKGGINKIICP